MSNERERRHERKYAVTANRNALVLCYRPLINIPVSPFSSRVARAHARVHVRARPLERNAIAIGNAAARCAIDKIDRCG